MLSGLLAFSLMQLTAAIEIKLHANESIASLMGYDDLIFFQPAEPPASPMTCSEQKPCEFCDAEMICGGSLPLDLSTGGDNKLSFVWEAPDDKVISIAADSGDMEFPPRTRVELELKTPDCEAEYQDIDINTVTLDFDDGGMGHTQSYTFLKGESFVEFQAECGIFTRMQFEPAADGILDLKFKKLTVTAIYDSQKVAQGELEYTWSTSGYIWMRKPEDGSIELEDFVGVPSTTTATSSTVLPLTTTTSPEVGTDVESTPKPTPLPTSSPPSSSPVNMDTFVASSFLILASVVGAM